MAQPTGVSRRIDQCLRHLHAEDFEGALVNLFPAVDKTAKKRFTKAGVGKRIKSFLTEELPLISVIANQANVFINMTNDGMSIVDAIYKFGRNALAHEGELNSRLVFQKGQFFSFGKDYWVFPANYISGLCVATVAAPENMNEYSSVNVSVEILKKNYHINELWGQRKFLEYEISSKLNNLDLLQKYRT